MTAATQPPRPPHWQIGPAIAAWLFPGLGHFVLGDRRRGLILMFAISSLYIAGLLIGGLDVIDSREDRLWYFGQLMAGPATYLIDKVHQNSLKPDTTQQLHRPFPNANSPNFQNLPYVRSVGRVNELATLYCAMAGLLNLLVIIDVAYSSRIRQPTTPSPALSGRIITRPGPTQ